MQHLDCPVDGCGMTFSSPTQESVLNLLVKHCSERHPAYRLDATALQCARAGIRYISTPRLEQPG